MQFIRNSSRFIIYLLFIYYLFIYLLPELPEPEWEAELKVFMLVSGGTS